jgi:WD40 repeat protein
LQSCVIRSDGAVFATAGWDKSVRVFSAKTMKELAVLKWHGEGVYAVAFGHVTTDVDTNEGFANREERGTETQAGHTTALIPRDQYAGIISSKQLQTASQRRQHKIQTSHWLAAGSKDCKISLWDIY